VTYCPSILRWDSVSNPHGDLLPSVPGGSRRSPDTVGKLLDASGSDGILPAMRVLKHSSTGYYLPTDSAEDPNVKVLFRFPNHGAYTLNKKLMLHFQLECTCFIIDLCIYF